MRSRCHQRKGWAELLEIMFSSTGGVGFAYRAALLAGLLAVAGCLLSRSPDLPEAEATKLILASEPFRETRSCAAGGTRDPLVRRRLLKIQGLQRKADSEADFCYDAAIEWRWESEDGPSCRGLSGVNHSYAEFRFDDRRWFLLELGGEGFDSDVFVDTK